MSLYICVVFFQFKQKTDLRNIITNLFFVIALKYGVAVRELRVRFRVDI